MSAEELSLRAFQRRTESVLAPVAHPRVLVPVALMEEVGEVSKLLLEHEAYGRPLDRDQLGGELADVLLCVAELATRYGVDLEAACAAKLADVAARAPRWAEKLGPALARARARHDGPAGSGAAPGPGVTPA